MDPIMKSIFGSMPLENLLKNQTNTINKQKKTIWVIGGILFLLAAGLGIKHFREVQLQKELDAIKIKPKK